MSDIDNSFRPATAKDAAELSDLAFHSKKYWGYSDAFMERCRAELTYTPDRIESERFRFSVLEAGGESVGFFVLEQRSPTEAELEALFVKPSFIGKGYGRALMERAKREAVEMGARSLVIQGDPNAEPFYRAAGARLAGRRESGSIPGRYLPLFEIELE